MAWVCLVLMLGPMGTACGQKSQEVERSGYTVRFDCRGGVPEIPSRVVYGPFGAPDISPTKEGYLFVCWETEGRNPNGSPPLRPDIHSADGMSIRPARLLSISIRP